MHVRVAIPIGRPRAACLINLRCVVAAPLKSPLPLFIFCLLFHFSGPAGIKPTFTIFLVSFFVSSRLLVPCHLRRLTQVVVSPFPRIVEGITHIRSKKSPSGNSPSNPSSHEISTFIHAPALIESLQSHTALAAVLHGLFNPVPLCSCHARRHPRGHARRFFSLTRPRKEGRWRAGEEVQVPVLQQSL